MERRKENKMMFWQTLTKDHLDDDHELSKDEWKRFVNDYEEVFARESSQLGRKLLWEFKRNDLKYLRKTTERNDNESIKNR
jgi:hypothetical protein